MMRLIFAILISIAFLLNAAVCEPCSIRKMGNTSPLILRNFGSRKLISRLDENVQLEVGESIKAYCSSSIKVQHDDNYYYNIIPEFPKSIKSAEFKCLPSLNEFGYKINSNDNFIPIRYKKIVISCNTGITHLIYESNRTLPNCDKHISYGVGNAATNMKNIIKAAICYDLDELELKYVNYLAQRPKFDFITKQDTAAEFQAVDLDLLINNFNSYFKFMSQSSFETTINEMKSRHELLKLHNFDYTSLLNQQSTVQQDLIEYQNMFNIVWWRNLRLGNWNFFMNALEERVQTSMIYNVYTGTAGVLTISYASSCNKTEILSIEADGLKTLAPKYIWIYLKSMQDNVAEDFVVIGYNSPFFVSADTAIFCKDICDEIEWLKNHTFGRVRLMPSQGVVFCCRPDEVAKHIPNFPINHKNETLPQSNDSTTESQIDNE